MHCRSTFRICLFWPTLAPVSVAFREGDNRTRTLSDHHHYVIRSWRAGTDNRKKFMRGKGKRGKKKETPFFQAFVYCHVHPNDSSQFFGALNSL